ncbi:hypothetical protein CBM2599_A10045 [Cupriavidus taiwanensis]|uniref:Uncharacterized protein n=1 Tax=Cupriavidus taiwanensis TaxID=164546 RepID=A0A375CZ43_9BURK|nr:hypothetical protein CBM2599_A10045 [Cupriavidus taiwanensis]SOY87755.1 hypothetical protein CBM2600_A170045 [Cupriavidus taiwanensis]SPD66148.1 protein of unknown function [Cupriavidus taiwanensis]
MSRLGTRCGTYTDNSRGARQMYTLPRTCPGKSGLSRSRYLRCKSLTQKGKGDLSTARSPVYLLLLCLHT